MQDGIFFVISQQWEMTKGETWEGVKSGKEGKEEEILTK